MNEIPITNDLNLFNRPPTTQEEQQLMCLEHPAATGALTIPTPPLRRMSDEVLLRVATRQTCAPFCGPPRFGKTFARGYVANEIRQMPRTLVVPFLCVATGSNSSNKFFNHLFNQIGGGIEDWGTDSMKSLHRAVNRLLIEASKKRATQIVFVVDEINLLSIAQLNYFSSITNMLSEKGLQVTVVSVGSMEMLSVREALVIQGRTDLVGRFYAGLRQFEGIRGADELGEVLALYDDPDAVDYPSGSGWALSRFFWPIAYDAGHRLQHVTEPLLKTFSAMAKPRSDVAIGAHYWAAAVRRLLIRSMNFHLPTCPFNQVLLDEVVSASGFVDALDVTFFTSSERRTDRRPASGGREVA